MTKRGQIDLPAHRRPGTDEQTAIRGFQKRMLTTPSGAGVQLQPTPLVRANLAQPRQWLVTLFAPTRGAQPLPYRSTFDGTNAVPTSATFGAPTFNAAGLILQTLQLHVMWGAGGVRNETIFDYPLVGGTFSITADSMDINAQMRSAEPVVYGATEDIPVISGFYVPGAPVDPTPMAWLEFPVALAGLADIWYAIKPFSKSVHLMVGTTGVAVERIGVEWYNTAGAQIAGTEHLQQAPGSFDLTLEPPHVATLLHVVNRTAVAKSLTVEWGIGLS
jgi:hypothetical protein